MRAFLRDLYLRVAGSKRKFKPGIHIINSHFVSRDVPNPDIYFEFLKILDLKAELIKIDEAVKLVNEKATTKDCLISFTFDDGFQECYSIIAPAVEEFGINSAFFINGGFINGDKHYKDNFTNEIILTPNKSPMNWEEIRDLHRRGHIIGSHTYDHINMNVNDKSLIESQILENKKSIEHYLDGAICEYFAYPFGESSFFNYLALNEVEKHHKYIFSATDYKNYFSFEGRVINRRHIECFWPMSHINYFLSVQKKY